MKQGLLTQISWAISWKRCNRLFNSLREKRDEQMPGLKTRDKSLAEAAARFVDAVHRLYPGINVRPIASFEDEDFTFEVAVPRNLSVDEVLDACHKECIKVVESPVSFPP